MQDPSPHSCCVTMSVVGFNLAPSMSVGGLFEGDFGLHVRA